MFREVICHVTSQQSRPVNSALLTGQQFCLLPAYLEVAKLSSNSENA